MRQGKDDCQGKSDAHLRPIDGAIAHEERANAGYTSNQGCNSHGLSELDKGFFGW
jgi:hypothetical protein